ncbi:MAG: hypothetical protein U0790_18935 [Isosphaeraceae bacterium]
MDETKFRALQNEVETLQERVRAQEARLEAAERRSRRRLAALVVGTGLVVAWSSTPEVRAQFGLTLSGLNARLNAVEAKTAPLSVNGTTLSISGVNVQIVDGTGSTQSDSGLGNLTVGYNRARGDGTNARTGSHNLILGDLNNYSSYGGLVVGSFNAVTDAYCSVSGGVGNTASVFGSSVSGGVGNTASGAESTVSGGYRNTAVGFTSSVSGGSFRAAPGDYNWAAGELFEAN